LGDDIDPIRTPGRRVRRALQIPPEILLPRPVPIEGEPFAPEVVVRAAPEHIYLAGRRGRGARRAPRRDAAAEVLLPRPTPVIGIPFVLEVPVRAAPEHAHIAVTPVDGGRIRREVAAEILLPRPVPVVRIPPVLE